MICLIGFEHSIPLEGACPSAARSVSPLERRWLWPRGRSPVHYERAPAEHLPARHFAASCKRLAGHRSAAVLQATAFAETKDVRKPHLQSILPSAIRTARRRKQACRRIWFGTCSSPRARRSSCASPAVVLAALSGGLGRHRRNACAASNAGADDPRATVGGVCC
jgi:hypothetical protein